MTSTPITGVWHKTDVMIDNIKVSEIEWKFSVSTMVHLNFFQTCKYTSLILKFKHKTYIQSSNTIIKHQWFNYCTILFKIYFVQVIWRTRKVVQCSDNVTFKEFRNVVMDWSE